MDTPSPFPDFSAELPGISMAADHVAAVVPDPVPLPEDCARLAAFNAGISLIPPATSSRPGQPEIMDIDAILEQLIQLTPLPFDATIIKIEPDINASPPGAAPAAPSIATTLSPSTHPPVPPLRCSTRLCLSNKKLDDFHLFTTVTDDGHSTILFNNDELADVCHYTMAHIAAKTSSTQKMTFGLAADLKRFGSKGESDVTKELTQFNKMDTFIPIQADDLTPTQRSTALTSLMFLTKKRDGTIKACTCTDGRLQCKHITKDKTTSPTISTDSIFMLAAINAHKRCCIKSSDLPGTFLNAYNDDFILMKMVGKLADLMVKTNPTLYCPFVSQDMSGRPILYVRLQKALYGLLKSALLFYKQLIADLTSIGLTLNPCNPCMANKLVNGKQFTIVWHVVDLTYSHVQQSVINNFVADLCCFYGDNIKVHTGKVHDYLGHTFDYSQADKAIISIISEFPETITGTAATPAADHLFQVRTDGHKWLSDKQARFFHHTTAQLLFASTCVRQDIQTAIAFLTT